MIVSYTLYHHKYFASGQTVTVFRECKLRMNPENLALAQEEATLTKIRNFLNGQKIKLWEPPYYDPERKIPNEVLSTIKPGNSDIFV